MTGKGKTLFFFCALLALSFFLHVTAQTPAEERVSISHQLWGEMLEKYVDVQGDVDYKSFSQNIDSLDEYLEYLASFEPRENWARAEALAFYINLYNAATVRLILQHYPVASIRDIKQPWIKKWIRVGEKELSLNQIEHKILRKMNEPRIHFAINCASASCPKLLNAAFEAQNIEKQLEEVARDFINDPARNEITPDDVAVSALFKWYKNDFTKEGSLLDYINKYADQPILQGTRISYLKYDWSLNEQ